MESENKKIIKGKLPSGSEIKCIIENEYFSLEVDQGGNVFRGGKFIIDGKEEIKFLKDFFAEIINRMETELIN